MIYKKEEIIKVFSNQVKSLYGKSIEINEVIDETIKKVDVVFSASSNKYYKEDREFSVFNSVQYCIFLYILSKNLLEKGDYEGADIVYCLNKALNSIDLYHGIDLPKIFGFEHPLGTVVGRAKFNGDYLFLYQGCTIGGSNGKYPVLENHITMFSDSKILGKAHIGEFVILGANAVIIDEDIPSYSLVFGQSPNLIVKRRTKEEMAERFKQFWK